MAGYLCAEEWGAKESALGDHSAWPVGGAGRGCVLGRDSRLGPSSGWLPWNRHIFESVINHTGTGKHGSMCMMSW